MRINFKFKNQDYNFPDNQKHIDLQSDLKQRIETILLPIQKLIEGEPAGHLEVNYNDETISHPAIKVQGFGPDNTPKIYALLQTM